MTEYRHAYQAGTPKTPALPALSIEDGDFWGNRIFTDVEARASVWMYWNLILDEKAALAGEPCARQSSAAAWPSLDAVDFDARRVATLKCVAWERLERTDGRLRDRRHREGHARGGEGARRRGRGQERAPLVAQEVAESQGDQQAHDTSL